MHRLFLLLALLVAVLVGAYLGSPYYAAKQLFQAAQHQDAEVLSSYIDPVALKNNIRLSMQSSLLEQLPSSANTASAMTEAIFANAFSDQIIDMLASPQAVGMLLRGLKPSLNPKWINKTAPIPDSSASYDGLQYFVLLIPRHNHPDKHFKLVLKRYGLVSWKVISYEI